MTERPKGATMTDGDAEKAKDLACRCLVFKREILDDEDSPTTDAEAEKDLEGCIKNIILEALSDLRREQRELDARICEDSVKWYSRENINECTMTPTELAEKIRNGG